MAEQQHYEFTAVEAKDILADRQGEWHSFTSIVTRAVIAVVVVLVLLLVFVA